MKALFIGAHNDDCEFNAGGVAALLSKKGWDILFVNPACIWHGENITKETRNEWEKQEYKAAEILGAKKIITGDRYQGLFQPSAEEIKNLAKIIVDFMPDIVFIHFPKDNHIEHRAVAEISEKALCLAHVKGTKIKEIYAFEAGADQTSDFFKPDFFIDISSVTTTLNESLMCYNQNTAQGEGLCHYKDILAKFRGSQALISSAEAFKIVKYPNNNEDFLLRQTLEDYFHWCGNGMYPAFGEYYF